MPRRLITSDLFKNEKVSELDYAGRYFFIGLITHADDEGRLKGSSKYLKGNIFPYDDISIETIETYKTKCHQLGIIHCYTINDMEIISFPSWEKHQTIRADRRKESNFPPPDNYTSTNSQPTDNQLSTECLHNINKDKLSKDNINKDNIREDVVGEIFKTFEDNFQKLTQKNTDILNDFIEEYGSDKVKNALDIAIKQNKRFLNYVEGVLKENGQQKRKESEGNAGNRPAGAFSDLD
jgi:DnaD/phage-associated family protein